MSEEALDLLGSVRRKRSEVFKQFRPDRLNGCAPADVKNVLVLDAASRSGSSFLHHLLSQHPDIISLNGEGLVFEKLQGLGLPGSEDDSDFIPEGALSSSAISSIAEDILKDSGLLQGSGTDDGFPDDDYPSDCVQRLILQYPEIDFSPETLLAACTEALRSGRSESTRFSTANYWLEVLEALRRRSYAVSPAHYDLRGSDPAADFPPTSAPLPPPFKDICLEEPPFVVPQPRRFPDRSRLAAKTLLLKSSSNCYHMRLVKRMFPKARFKFVVLTRNPAAAVSGLMDGWLSNGFYSRNIGRLGSLAMPGYSQERLPWTTKWWNFDLPPGWAALRGRPLEEVCAHQWASANEHILRDIGDKTIGDHLRVRYESLLDAASLSRELGRIFEYAGLEGPPPSDAFAAPRVMCVAPPAPQKWRKRREVLAPLIASSRIAALAAELGYDPAGWASWT
ncbi:MAG: hypothetical protein A2506_02805 [Elusimicrobia bacterium RIFOXYD12_FULL_66_9]|nr:MAG: hypothetical protein A2506_02805 [Elusimicrobia bacterium RIFOXYD12_FULL_66_9]